jgi:glycosidase
MLIGTYRNHTGDVFKYAGNMEPVYQDEDCPVAGFYDKDREPTLPFKKVNLKKHPDAYPDGAIWPQELQDPANFMRKGRIGPYGYWDKKPDYLEGDFYDFKKLNLGHEEPNHFKPTIGLLNLIEIYKFWITFADLDGFRLDAAKHIGDGPLRFFTSCIHEFAERIGKNNFIITAEIAGETAFDTVHNTGMNAALGIGPMQELLWKIPKGLASCSDYFNLFKNAKYLKTESHKWLRNEIICMIDDHDQVWKPVVSKGRFCSEGWGSQLLLGALALNLFTLGIPCIYYGTEQNLDGCSDYGEKGYPADQYIREAMFGGGFGPFRSRGAHVFNERQKSYIEISKMTALRKKEIALRRGYVTFPSPNPPVPSPHNQPTNNTAAANTSAPSLKKVSNSTTPQPPAPTNPA